MKQFFMAATVVCLAMASLAQDAVDRSETTQPSGQTAEQAYADASRREQILERDLRNSYQKSLIAAQRQLVDDLKKAKRDAEREKRDNDAMVLSQFAQDEQRKLDTLSGGWTATIQAAQDWQHVVSLPRGKYLVTASGKWSDNPMNPLVGPEGDPVVRNPPLANESTLIARVNGNVFKVGKRAVLNLADDENYVEMAMNDSDHSDNRGSVEAMITEQGPSLPDQYFVGNFAGEGRDGMAVLRGNKFLYQTHGIASAESAEITLAFGDPGTIDEYLVGDFTGIGRDELAVRRGKVIQYQKYGINSKSSQEGTFTFGEGNSEDEYLVGNFTGTGRDELAVRRGNAIYYQRNGIDSTMSQIGLITFGTGNSEDQYLVGDFTGVGRDGLAVRRGNKIFYQTNGITSRETEVATVTFGKEDPQQQYFVGHFLGFGRHELAVRSGDEIFL